MFGFFNIKISSQSSIAANVNKTITGLVDNVASVPVVAKASPKNVSLIIRDATVDLNDQFLVLSSESKTPNSQPKTNEEAKIDKERSEPLVIFGLKALDFLGEPYSPVSAAVTQAYLEDRVSQEFAARIFDVILREDEKAFDQLEASLRQQTQDAQNTIEQLNIIFRFLKDTNRVLSPDTARESISSIARQAADDLGKPEPLLANQPMATDPYSLIEGHCVQSSIKNLKQKSRTALTTQALQFAAQTLFRGYTPKILGMDLVSVPVGWWTVADSLRNSKGVNQQPATLKTLSMKNHAGQNYVYGFDNEAPYVNRDFYKKLHAPAHRRSLALVTMLANEYAISAGLGRLSGTPLGNRFGSDIPLGTGDKWGYVDSYLGVRAVESSTAGQHHRGSLIDYLLVSNKGDAVEIGSKRLCLLDGNFVVERGGVLNSFDTFMKSVARDPTNNKVNLFDGAIDSADDVFKQGLNFYKKLHLRDKTPVLLTPRGLYTRMLEELSTSLDQFGVSKDAGKELDIMETSLFKILAEGSKNDTSPDSRANVVKRFLLSMMARKALLQLSGKGFDSDKTDAAANKSSQKTTSTTVTIKTGKEDPVTSVITATSNQSDENNPENIEFSQDAIRFSSDDGDFIKKKIIDFEDDSANDRLDAFRTYPTESGVPGNPLHLTRYTENFFEDIYDSESSLLNRIVRIYLDMHDEAKRLSKSENDVATFLTSGRFTRNSQIDGTLSLSMLLEAMLDLVSMFVNAQTQDTKKKPKKSKWGFSFSTPKIKFKTPFSHNKFSIKTFVGTDSQAGFAARALKLLIQGSKANNFGVLSTRVGDKNLIPDLDSSPEGIIVTASSYGSELSFLTMQDFFFDLARERDIAMAALTSVSAIIEHTQQQTRNISDLAAMLRGEKKATDLAQSLIDFSNKPIGEDYLTSISDYSLSISQRRLNRYHSSLSKRSKRVPKLTEGEVVCMIPAFKQMGSTASDNLIFCTVGLPGDYISDTLLPAFRLASGHASNIFEQITAVQVGRDGVFDDIKYDQVTKNFFVLNLIDSSSFEGFEDNPPQTFADVVKRATLTTGVTGEKFIKQYSDDSREMAQQSLSNEVFSYLVRKAFSVLSSTDLLEENLVKIDYTKRSAGSATLARKICSAAKIDESTFDQSFVVTKSRTTTTRLSELEMLKTTSSKVKKIANGQTFESQKISVATAELFYDIFDSIYFHDGLIEERVFSPAYFDKTMGFLFEAFKFRSMSGKAEEVVKLGKKISTDNQLSIGLTKSDVTPGTVSVNSYAINVVPADPLVRK